MSLLSSDILHQVFKFFVSNNQIVDGESLRVASLVCKQWRGVADSRSLWDTSVGKCDQNNHKDNGDSCSRTVHRSLQVKERIGDSLAANASLLQASLMGFTKLKYFGNESPESDLYFFVRERASGTKLLLSISWDERKSIHLLRDIYNDHFQLKEDFPFRDNNRSNKNINSNNRGKEDLNSRPFPLGISVWQGRVIRWYRSGSETEAIETIDRIHQRKSPIRQDIEHNDREKNISFLRQIINLEKNSRKQKKDVMYYAHGRHHMVDWIVEIVECFCLEDRTIFQAMLLFDRFLTSYDRVVSTSSFQLVAGACLLIASKCNNVVVSEKDICFCCDNIFSVSNVIATEELILEHLEWRLACPTSLEFMMEFLTIHGIGKDARMSSLCSYILELSLASHTNLKYPPSVIAASSMVLAFYCLRKSGIHSLWPEELANITGLELDKDLVQCSVDLSQDIENVRHTTQRLDMIQRRNSKPCRHNIAEISIPILTSKTTLTDCEERLRSRTIIPRN